MDSSAILALTSVVIALVSLAVSAIAVYLQFIRQIEDVRMLVVDAVYVRGDPHSNEDPYYRLDLTFVNRGNRPAQVIDLTLSIKYSRSLDIYDLEAGSRVGTFLLDPGALVYRRIRAAVDRPGTGTFNKRELTLTVAVIGSRSAEVRTTTVPGFSYTAADFGSMSSAESYREIVRLV